jgi:hypothetical protein
VSDGLSRAELVRWGARGGAVVVASGTGFVALVPTAAATAPDGDLAYLRVLLAVELLSVDFGTQALASGKLGRRAAALLKQVRGDDHAHSTGLGVMLTAAGQTPTTPDDIDFSYPTQSYASQGAIVKLGSSLARLSLGAYLGAVEKLETSQLRGPLAQIAANEAQHVSAFAQLLGRPVVGKAFAAALPIDDVSAALGRYES